MEKTLEKASLLWVKRVQSSNLPMNRPVLHTKAAEIALNLAVEDFNASDDWLACFKTKHGLVYRSVCGESVIAGVPMRTDWQTKKL